MYFKNLFAYLLPEKGPNPFIASGYSNGQKGATLKNRHPIDDRDHMLFPFYNKTKANCFLINRGNRLYTNGALIIRMIKQNCLKGQVHGPAHALLTKSCFSVGTCSIIYASNMIMS